MLFWLFLLHFWHLTSYKWTLSFLLFNLCLSCWFYAHYCLMIATCWNHCHGKCIFPLKMKKLSIPLFLVFSQFPNSNLCVKVHCILTCLSHSSKVHFSFEFLYFVLACQFSPLWRSYKFFPKNLLLHFMRKHHHISLSSSMSQHFASHLTNAITYFPSHPTICTCM